MMMGEGLAKGGGCGGTPDEEEDEEGWRR